MPRRQKTPEVATRFKPTSFDFDQKKAAASKTPKAAASGKASDKKTNSTDFGDPNSIIEGMKRRLAHNKSTVEQKS